ncbi:MAG: sulfatase family protein [Candidatus Thorarchaeota archaeon]
MSTDSGRLSAHAKRRLPNIVYIMADDMGYGDLGCYNPASRIPTPNIDQLAAEGVRFTDAHAPSSVCTPSRYGVLTGRYCWRSALKRQVLYSYEPPLIEKDRLTLASMLKAVGYHTAAVGKWHLGLGYSAKEGEWIEFDRPLPWPLIAGRPMEEKIDFTRPLWGGPLDLGFDYFYGTSGCSTAQPPYAFIENDRFVDIPTIYHDTPLFTSRPGMMAPGWDHKDVDLAFCHKATKYIVEQSSHSAPFFLYLNPSAPHEPCVESVVPEIARGKSGAGPRGDLVWLFDWLVGQVMQALRETGQADNTLLIVTSDNGALPGDRVLMENGQEKYNTYGHRSCGDWRGYKSHIWEGGHREPLLVYWPGVTPRNAIVNQLVCFTDFMATIAAIVRYELPGNAGEDSYDMLPALTGEAAEGPVRESVVHHSVFGVYSIRQGEWKLILETQGSGGWPPPSGGPPEMGMPGQLYNLREDPQETVNLWDERPDVVRDLIELLKQYKGSTRTASASTRK